MDEKRIEAYNGNLYLTQNEVLRRTDQFFSQIPFEHRGYEIVNGEKYITSQETIAQSEAFFDDMERGNLVSVLIDQEFPKVIEMQRIHNNKTHQVDFLMQLGQVSKKYNQKNL